LQSSFICPFSYVCCSGVNLFTGLSDVFSIESEWILNGSGIANACHCLPCVTIKNRSALRAARANGPFITKDTLSAEDYRLPCVNLKNRSALSGGSGQRPWIHEGDPVFLRCSTRMFKNTLCFLMCIAISIKETVLSRFATQD